MKKVLLSTAALAGLAFVAAAPARADEPALQLGLGGYMSGYAVYTDQDDASATSDYRKFDFRKDSEVHLNGEVALDNGITAGAHIELLTDRADNATNVEESYLYLSSSWGRINFGEEDGIAYLIQVAPPTAEDKIDGARPDIGTFLPEAGGTLSYAQDPFVYTNKFTYITPVFSGFQAGFSYTPSVTDADLNGTTASVVSNSAAGLPIDWQNGWELAARYEGTFEALDVAIGAGYSHASQETDAASPDDDDLVDWNVGLNLGYGAFGFGAAYVSFDETGDHNETLDGWDFGADYVTGPYKFGVSYLTVTQENDPTSSGSTATTTADTDIDRWTVGAIYEWGPGMTFRGAVQYQDVEDLNGTATSDYNGTQVSVGTQLNF